jgi:hypothetical protein
MLENSFYTRHTTILLIQAQANLFEMGHPADEAFRSLTRGFMVVHELETPIPSKAA